MKKLAWLILAVFILAGCQPSHDMILAEIAYYSAISETIKAQGNGSKPLVEIVSKDPKRPMVFDNVERIIVYNTPQPTNGPLVPQYKQVDYSAPWAPVALSGLGIAGAVTGNVLLLREAGKYFTGGTNYNNLGENSSIKIQGGTTANATMSGGTLGQIGPTDATSIPTVVEQPPPVIVPAAEPVVVNQPAPVVVQ